MQPVDFSTSHEGVGMTARPIKAPMARPTWAFMRRHLAHWVALGLGSGLSPKAPGTAGTLWAWAAFLLLNSLGLTAAHWAGLIAFTLLAGWWASTVTARNLGVKDPGNIVIDEIAAFWLVLWLVMPAGLGGQLAAFILFRYFDAVKPGPVGWADRLFHFVDVERDRMGWTKAGFGIMLDDLVAAFCTLLVIAFWRLI